MLTSLLARNVPVAKYVSTDYYVVRNLSNELIAKWACNAHKIRQIRHLRGVIARCTSKKIRAIGAIRELLYNKVQISSLLLSQLVCHSGKGNCPVNRRHANGVRHQALPHKTKAPNASSNGGDASRGKDAAIII